MANGLEHIVVVTGLSVGATFLYIFGNYFLRDLIREKFLNKFQNLEIKFKKSEFFYLLVYRFIGGVPWQISCLLPTLFNVRVKNFLFATFLGIIPQIFLAVSIGSGIEKVIDQNSEVPRNNGYYLFSRYLRSSFSVFCTNCVFNYF